MRTAAREAAFKVVFASRFTGEYDKNLQSALIKNENLTEDDAEYVNNVLSVVFAHQDQFMRLVDGHSRDFPASRLFPADISILLVALAELKYFDDIPTAVSLNEAANIASKYSSAKSASFISGILAEIAKE